MRSLLFGLLSLCLAAAGCTPQPSSSRSGESASVGEQLERSEADREKEWATDYAVVYVIVTEKNRPADSGAFLDSLKPLLDRQQNVKLSVNGVSPWRVQMAPVKDPMVFGEKMSFGRVLAYEPAKRTFLVEYGAAPAGRGEWDEKLDIEREVLVRRVLTYTRHDRTWLGKELGEGRVVPMLIRFHGTQIPEGVREKLLKLVDEPAKATSGGIRLEEGGGLMTLGPVKDVEAFAKKITFAKVALVDGRRRVLVLDAPSKSAGKGP